MKLINLRDWKTDKKREKYWERKKSEKLKKWEKFAEKKWGLNNIKRTHIYKIRKVIEKKNGMRGIKYKNRNCEKSEKC